MAILGLSLIVLARLLSPGDFGLLAIVLALVGFGEIFRDFGLSQATVQAATISHAQRTNVLWINTFIGLALSVTLALISYPLSVFVGDERVAHVALALSPVFLINGISAQYRADLNRHLRFGALAACDLIPQAVGLLCAILGGIWGWGYWALVANQLTVALLAAALLPLFSRWLPGKYDRSASVRSLLSFGGNLLGVQTMVYVSRNIDRVIIAGSLGVAQLGIYDRAYQLLMMPLNQINAPANRVALPVLSKLASNDARYNSYLLRGQNIILHILSAVFALGTATSSILIPLILGNQWQGAVPIFQAFSLAGFAQAAGYVTFWIFLSKGLTRSNLWYTLSTRPLIIAAVFIGATWGAVGIAWSYSIVLFVLWPLGILWVKRLVPIPAGRLINNGLRCLLIHGVAGTSAWLTIIFCPLGNSLSLLALGCLAYFLTLVVIAALFKKFRQDLRTFISLASLARRK